MKKITFISAALLSLAVTAPASAQLKIGGKKFDTNKVLQGVSNIATAATLSDAQVAELCREYIEWSDENNPVSAPDSKYTKRLNELVGHIKQVNGMPVNFKVYEVADINAFASGDGSIRVFAGLMEVMDDDQLMAIIGHEIGHVVNTDTKDAMKNAYLTSGLLELAGAGGGKVEQMTNSEWTSIGNAFLESKFSRTQEYAADDYGYNFCIQNGRSPYGMASSLEKLVELFESGGDRTSLVDQMFSSHPESAERARRVRAKADEYVKNNQ